jgi:hypothetical protein
MPRILYLSCLLLVTAARALEAQTIELTDLPGIVVSANAFGGPGGEPNNAIDNKDYADGQFSWTADDHGAPGDPNWLELDFGSNYSLTRVEVRGVSNFPDWQGFDNVFNLLTKSDFGSWITIGSGTIVDTNDLNLRDKTFNYASGDQPLARYLRYEVVGGTHWSYLGEINVQGSPVPEPCTIALAAAGLVGIAVRRHKHREGRKPYPR